ncbi:MAG: hypothetical protein AXW12_19765 [Thalassospira sp. Nap_22]|nr:MAG: hypothetical protein AXW12_19765 [Thalassospira sp. Nap_22]
MTVRENEADRPSWLATVLFAAVGFVGFSGEDVGLFSLPTGDLWDFGRAFLQWIGVVTFLGVGWDIAVRVVPEEEERAKLRAAQAITVNLVCTGAAILLCLGIEELVEYFQ